VCQKGLVSLSTAEAEPQMLCEGSLATKNVGTLLKEMAKPQKEFKERNETIGKTIAENKRDFPRYYF
jgi:hypothetical protein